MAKNLRSPVPHKGVAFRNGVPRLVGVPFVGCCSWSDRRLPARKARRLTVAGRRPHGTRPCRSPDLPLSERPRLQAKTHAVSKWRVGKFWRRRKESGFFFSPGWSNQTAGTGRVTQKPATLRWATMYTAGGNWLQRYTQAGCLFSCRTRCFP